jgi:hypothetical protein
MEQNGYPSVSSEKTISMKSQGSDFVMHGLFVDEIMSHKLCDEFLEIYLKDFEITGGGFMETFLGMDVE